MITRLRRESALAALIVASAFLTVACQKVPLLAPSGSTITLTALATVLPVNGSTDIIAQLIEASGTPPHSGTSVTFTTNLGTVQPSQAETDIAGRVTVKYLASNGSGTATITAISGGVSASGTNAIKIAIGAAAVGTVRVDANPSIIPASGGTSTITATAFDSNGNLLTTVPVSFTTDAGAVSPAVATTDGNGKAQTTLTTTKAATVTASAGITSGTGTGTGSTTTSPQSATVKVNVNVSPSITVGTPSPPTPSVGQSVTFPLTYGTDANGSPVQSVTVDFGDGSRPTVLTGKPASVSHTYNTIGSFSVRATVTDALGDTSSAASSVNVGALGSVTVGSPSPSSPSVGQAVTFPITYNDTGNTIQRITMSWGDGTPDSAFGGKPTSVNHTYLTSGTFAVRVTAFDSFGNQSSGGTSVQVGSRQQPTVTISTTTTNPTAGSDITFTGTVTPAAGSGTNIADVVVNYGDPANPGTTNLGPVSGAITLHHVYPSGGTYTVTLTATDSNGGVGTGSTSVFVQAATPLGVTVSFNQQNVNSTNTLVTFTATVTGLGNAVVTQYQWNFGDGGTALTTTNQVVHNYTRPSIPPTLVATVTITTSDNRSATGQSTPITP